MIFSVFFFCPLLYFMPTFVLGRKVKKRRNSILGYKMWPIVHEKFTIFGHLPTFCPLLKSKVGTAYIENVAYYRYIFE